MFCSQCGTPADQNATFCAKCGNKLVASERSVHESINTEVSSSPVEAITTRPWVRYWARMFDIYVFSIICGFFLGIVAPQSLDKMNAAALGMIILFIWIFVESLLLSSFQTTPGKWLLKTKLVSASGEKINFSQALARSLKVWWRGLGTGFPIATLITLIVANKNLTRDGITSWDRESGFIVTHETIGVPRILAAIAFFIVMFILIVIEKIV
ncbi:MAG: RDD family protein [Smithellaceae bacterium]|jgi:uncharacterized RDD family membrane protein YckC|nr:RDD family protein [Syntrophaceae bacterium]